MFSNTTSQPVLVGALIGLAGIIIGALVNLRTAYLNLRGKREEGTAGIVIKQAELTNETVWKYITELQSARLEDRRVMAESQTRIGELERRDREREEELTVAKRNYEVMRGEVDKLRNFMKNVIASASGLGMRVSERGHLTLRTDAVVAILDDEEGVRENLTDLLAESDLEVYAAADFDGLVAMLQQYPVRVLLLDVYLAETSATAVVDALRANPVYRDIRVILMSCGADAATTALVAELRPFAFLAKPANEVDVLRTVRSAVNSLKVAQPAPPDRP